VPEPEPEPEPEPQQQAVHLAPGHGGTQPQQQSAGAPVGDPWQQLEAQALGQWGSGNGAALTTQKIEWDTGASWDGQTRDGWYEGSGRMTYYEGSKYKGTYLNGKRHGTGTARLANVDVYDGAWAFGRFHGMGRYHWVNGDEYTGPFENGKEHGEGGVKIWAGVLGEDGGEKGRYEGTLHPHVAIACAIAVFDITYRLSPVAFF